jgi:hypothetical protein
VLAFIGSECVKLKHKEFSFSEPGRQTEDAAVTAVLSTKTITVCKALPYNKNNFARMRFEVLTLITVHMSSSAS